MVFGESFVNVVSVSLNHGPGLKVLIHFDGKKKILLQLSKRFFARRP